MSSMFIILDKCSIVMGQTFNADIADIGVCIVKHFLIDHMLAVLLGIVTILICMV